MIILIPERFKQIDVEFPIYLQNKETHLTYKFCSEDCYIELVHSISRVSITKKDFFYVSENCLNLLTGLLTNNKFNEISEVRYLAKRKQVEKSLNI